MSDVLDANFSWEDIDRRLVSSKTLDLSEEMHKRVADGELRIAHETAQSGNSAGYLPRLFDFHEQLTDEWIRRLYSAYCEAWTEQNHSISPEFIRAVRENAIVQLIAARTSSVRAGVELRAWRISEEANPYSLAEWERRMGRLRARWVRRLESWAAACEYRAAREQPVDETPRADPPAEQRIPRVAEINLSHQGVQSKKLGRPPRFATDFTIFAGSLWHAAMDLNKNKTVSNADLSKIALRLDEHGYLPPADYLEKSHARQLRVYNSRNSHSKVGPVKTWSQLVSLADKDHLRGMRRMLSRCAQNAERRRNVRK